MHRTSRRCPREPRPTILSHLSFCYSPGCSRPRTSPLPRRLSRPCPAAAAEHGLRRRESPFPRRPSASPGLVRHTRRCRALAASHPVPGVPWRAPVAEPHHVASPRPWRWRKIPASRYAMPPAPWSSLNRARLAGVWLPAGQGLDGFLFLFTGTGWLFFVYRNLMALFFFIGTFV
jgi:hypothetical protein